MPPPRFVGLYQGGQPRTWEDDAEAFDSFDHAKSVLAARHAGRRPLHLPHKVRWVGGRPQERPDTDLWFFPRLPGKDPYIEMVTWDHTLVEIKAGRVTAFRAVIHNGKPTVLNYINPRRKT